MKIPIFILIVLIFTGCFVSTDNFPEPNKLRTLIAQSIEIPFTERDTVIYDSIIKICGNSSADELNKIYNPQLNQPPYSNILIKNYSGKIWFTGEKLNNMIDSLCQKRTEYKIISDCFYENKIEFKLSGRAISNNSVELYERYTLNNKEYYINKVFKYSYISQVWNYDIIKNESRKIE